MIEFVHHSTVKIKNKATPCKIEECQKLAEYEVKVVLVGVGDEPLFTSRVCNDHVLVAEGKSKVIDVG